MSRIEWRKAVLARPATTVAAALLAAACASAPSGGSKSERTRIEAGNGAYDLELTRDRLATRHTLQAPVDSVWNALPDAYTALGLTGGIIDPATRQFGMPRPTLAPHTLAGQRLSRLLSCGSTATGAKADSYEVRYVVTSRVSAADAGTRVDTRVEATARPRGTGSRPIECASTGVLEQMLADSLSARLGKEPGGAPRTPAYR